MNGEAVRQVFSDDFNSLNPAEDFPERRRISLEEACSVVGVSAETLTRFIEAGYFPGASKENGVRVVDLEGIFGVRIPAQFLKTVRSAGVQPSAAAEVVGGELSRELNSTGQLEPEVATNSGTESGQPPEVTHNASDDNAFGAVPRRNLIEMYERLTAQLQSEIKSLRSERDWLKTRIERYEEKSSRDQLLMLAETQAIKSLINSREPNRSPMRSALEWLGLLPPAPAEADKKN